MPNSVEGSDPDHFLALKLARDALADAGYAQSLSTGKNGHYSRAWNYINRGFTNLLQHGLVVDQTLDLLRQLQPQLNEILSRKSAKNLKRVYCLLMLRWHQELCPMW
jgi:hypothetical protein